MRIKDILYNVVMLEDINFSEDKEIVEIVFDSRKVKKDTLFVAIKGNEYDGHNFIEKANINGASVIICEVLPTFIYPNVTYIKVKNTHDTLAKIASNFYGNPSEKINIIGVTGTNGKTTTSTLLYELFNLMGEKSGLVSTINIKIGEKEIPSNNTTPDALTLNKFFNEMVENGCRYCFIEVSSHGIDQKRVSHIKFKGGIFTNITHDHLDYHKTFKNYLYTKKNFFDSLPKGSFALSNIDDKNGEIILQNTKAHKYFYSLKEGITDFKAKILESGIGIQYIILDGKEFYTPLSGEFNIYNLLSVYATAVLCGKTKEEILINLSKLKGVIGRFQTFISDKGATVIVDYAHTPDALENIIYSINKNKGDKKLITIIGCGGNRDREKRPIMGKIATEKSDEIIFTSDNPRNEDPKQILYEMKGGVSDDNKNKYIVIEDRKEAIKYGCKISNNKTILLIAGKGHETYQEFGNSREYHDDMEIAKKFLDIF